MADDAAGTATTNAGTDTGTDAGTGSGNGAPDTGSKPDDGTFIVPALKTQAPEFDAFVPSEYSDKDWVKDIRRAQDPRTALFQAYENAQKKLGERAAVTYAPPPADASEEVRKAYNEAIGMPADVSGYSMPVIEWADESSKKLGEAISSSRSPEFVQGLYAIALEEGVPPAKLQNIISKHDKLFVQLNGKTSADQAAAAETQAKAMNDAMMKQFGTQDLPAVRARVWRQFESSVPAEYKAAIDRADNELLMAVSITLEKNFQQYGRPDKVKLDASSMDNTSLDSVRTERYKLLEQREDMIKNNKARGPAYDEVNRKINDLNNNPVWAGKK